MALANKENHPSTAVHNKFSKLISAYTGDDPLATWVAYEAVVPVRGSPLQIQAIAR